MIVGNEKPSSGFTLIELLVTLAVAVILATVAVPGFQSMMTANRLSADYNEILSGINYARSEAVKRRTIIVLEITNDSPWEYRIYPEGDASDVLRTREASDGRVSATVGSVGFTSLGRRDSCIGWAGCTLAISWGSDSASGIEVSLTGRVSKTDTIPE